MWGNLSNRHGRIELPKARATLALCSCTSKGSTHTLNTALLTLVQLFATKCGEFVDSLQDHELKYG